MGEPTAARRPKGVIPSGLTAVSQPSGPLHQPRWSPTDSLFLAPDMTGGMGPSKSDARARTFAVRGAWAVSVGRRLGAPLYCARPG